MWIWCLILKHKSLEIIPMPQLPTRIVVGVCLIWYCLWLLLVVANQEGEEESCCARRRWGRHQERMCRRRFNVYSIGLLKCLSGEWLMHWFPRWDIDLNILLKSFVATGDTPTPPSFLPAGLAACLAVILVNVPECMHVHMWLCCATWQSVRKATDK